MAITYRSDLNAPLSHTQMDNNFRSVYFSSSLHGTDNTQLRLWKDVDPSPQYDAIELNPGTGNINISGNEDNRVLTGTGTGIAAEANLTFNGSLLTITGTVSLEDSENNLVIGAGAGGSGVTAGNNTVIGKGSSANITGTRNTALGATAAAITVSSTDILSLGHGSLIAMTSGNENVALGSGAGKNLQVGTGNIYLGYSAGSAATATESNKLYINNAASNTPLILGDFSTGHLTINSTVSASIFSGSFVGNGSGLTGVTATVFPYTGSAVISGSLFVENNTSLSGSVAVSGSFKVHNSGSNPLTAFRVENGVTTVDKNITISNHGRECSIGIGNLVTENSTIKPNHSTMIGHNAGQYAMTHCLVAIGNCASWRGGRNSVRIGYHAGKRNDGIGSIGIGWRALGSFNNANGAYNIAIGQSAMGSNPADGSHNIGIGCSALAVNQKGVKNVAIGSRALITMHGASTNTSDSNVVVGYGAGENISRGKCNVIIGAFAGPSGSNIQADHKLYINNAVGHPLIGGEFYRPGTQPSVTISGSLFVSQSVTAVSFSGDGSNLTNLPGTEWDGSRNGNAEITGSFTVSGSSVTVDLTNTLAISGSIFSGSFVGNGSGLTGVTSEWDGSRNGNAEITGSLDVTGKTNIQGVLALGTAGNPVIEMIHFHSGSLAGVHNIQSFAISATGYTGFKADYSLSNTNQEQKKIGTLLGGWDTSGGTTINDSHTQAVGAINGTSFDITSNGSTAILRLNASGGPYEVNMLITAFKRQV